MKYALVKVAAQSVFDHTIRLQFKSKKTVSIVRPKLLAATFLRRLDSGLRITIGLRSVSVCWCSPLPLIDGASGNYGRYAFLLPNAANHTRTVGGSQRPASTQRLAPLSRMR
jgi:hypothetical protein